MIHGTAMLTGRCIGAVRRALLATALAALMFGAAPSSDAAGGRGKPPPSAPPNPDIVYMSNASNAPSKPAIRGVTLTLGTDSVSSSDAQLLKALDGREWGSIAWSPDGTRYAWIEGKSGPTRRIMWAAPGKAATVLYQPGGVADPYVADGTDVLAWGPGCSGDNSVLFFAREAKWDAVQEIYTESSAIMAIDIGAAPDLTRAAPRLLREAVHPGRFAVSPRGRLLAYGAGVEDQEGVWSLPLPCALDAESGQLLPEAGTPTRLLTWLDLGAPEYPCDPDPTVPCHPYPRQSAMSIDWSRDGLRLALSVTVGPEPGYPWRDLRVAYIDYSLQDDVELAALDRVLHVNLDPVFGDASSEHSPQWGPSELDNSCERIAFAQSAGAVDGSDLNGRRLFLLDLQAVSQECFIGTPLQIPARNPRVLDWK